MVSEQDDRPRCTGPLPALPVNAECSTCGHRVAAHTNTGHCDVCAIIDALRRPVQGTIRTSQGFI